MSDRAKRRMATHEKFISRIKMWYNIEGRPYYETWIEYLDKNRWLHKHKHNKLKRRSNMNNLEKKKSHKRERVEGRKTIENSDI
jgi:hypothetical protein